MKIYGKRASALLALIGFLSGLGAVSNGSNPVASFSLMNFALIALVSLNGLKS